MAGGGCLGMVPTGSHGQEAAFLASVLLLFDFFKAGERRQVRVGMRAFSPVCSSAPTRSLLGAESWDPARPTERGSAFPTSTPVNLKSAGPAVPVPGPVPIAVVKVKQGSRGTRWPALQMWPQVTVLGPPPLVLAYTANPLLHPPDPFYTFWCRLCLGHLFLHKIHLYRIYHTEVQLFVIVLKSSQYIWLPRWLSVD